MATRQPQTARPRELVQAILMIAALVVLAVLARLPAG